MAVVTLIAKKIGERGYMMATITSPPPLFSTDLFNIDDVLEGFGEMDVKDRWRLLAAAHIANAPITDFTKLTIC